MKKYVVIFAPAAFLLLIVGMICSSPDGLAQNQVKTYRGIVIPDDIKTIFKNSCMPCHSTDGKKLAKMHVNFSKWNKYVYRAQVQKSRAICLMITKDKMPPAQFKESNPDLVLNPAQKESICNWVNTVVLKRD